MKCDKDISQEITLRLLKIIDIGYITTIYFFIGMILAKACDHGLGNFEEKYEEKKGLLRRTLELIGLIWSYCVITYIVRNLVELIPSPADGFSGFKHCLVKELKQADVFTFVFLGFQRHLQAKVLYYLDHFM
jgi:hypothetical protein